MATYDHKQVLTDYARGTITPEMAVGHSLQHIDALYAAQSTARTEWRTEIDAIKQQVHQLQATVDHLAAVIEKARTRQKAQNAPAHPKADQP
jgi:predicted  nucleic acid-binding Zn-ribbon protein